MKIDTEKLDLLLARRCMALQDLRCGTSPQTLSRIRRGEEITTRTAGKIARVLGVDPAEIVQKGKEAT